MTQSIELRYVGKQYDKVFLAVPTRGTISWQTVTRLNEIRDKAPGLRPILYQSGNLSVALTRNTIVQKFLLTNCDVLVMVDDDIVPPPDALQYMVPFLPEFGIVAIPHPMPHPSDPGVLILTAFDVDVEAGLRPTSLANGINTCAAVATGCCAISRKAILAAGELPFEMSNNPNAAVTSDDFLFCAKLRKLGFKIGVYLPENGWFADHVSTVNLAPILEDDLRRELHEYATM